MINNSIDIVLPCYNPPKSWEVSVVSSIEKLISNIPEIDEIHLILVNDGSDSSIDEAVGYIREHIEHFTYIDHQTNRGKGHALKVGMAHAKNHFSIFTDIDFPFEFESYVNVIKALKEEKASIILGKRGESYYENIPPQRIKLSRILKFFNRLLLRLPEVDTQGGLKGMDPKAKELFKTLKSDRYLIDLEFVKRAFKKKISIHSVNIELREGVALNPVPLKILLKEINSFIRILFI